MCRMGRLRDAGKPKKKKKKQKEKEKGDAPGPSGSFMPTFKASNEYTKLADAKPVGPDPDGLGKSSSLHCLIPDHVPVLYMRISVHVPATVPPASCSPEGEDRQGTKNAARPGNAQYSASGARL